MIRVAEIVLIATPVPLVVFVCLLNMVALFFRYKFALLAVGRESLLLLGLSMLFYAFAYAYVNAVANPLVIEVRALFRLAFVVVLSSLTVANVSSLLPAYIARKTRDRNHDLFR